MYDKAEKVFNSETLVDCLMYWVYDLTKHSPVWVNPGIREH